MPELPEVETIRRQLVTRLPGRTVIAADTHWSEKFVEAREIVGTTIETVGRRGKDLIHGLEDGHEMVLHLGMTGQLTIDERPGVDDHVRARWQLDDGATLTFRDIRRFGRIRVVAAGDYSTIATLHTMGPEPFDPSFSGEHLYSAIRKSDRRVKTQLLSQRPVAGVGNIYADEALWLAQVHPATRSLSRPRSQRLRNAIVDVLTSAITHGGTTLRDYRTVDGEHGDNQFYLRCYGRGGEPCDRCGRELRASVWDARTTTWCPTCQKR